MEWSYSSYIAANVGIGAALFIMTYIIILFVSWHYHIRNYIIRTVATIDLEQQKATDEAPDKPKNRLRQFARSQQQKDTMDLHSFKFIRRKNRVRCLSCSFACMSAIIIGIMPVLIFEGCFLASFSVSNGDACPDDPMTCFVFEKNVDHTQKGTFQCLPGNSANFTAIIPDGYAWCYGWVITRQTTKKVLDQLGICAGLIGIFATLFALFILFGKGRVIYVIIVILIVALVTAAIVLLAVYRWALSVLTYITLGVSLVVTVWSLVLVCILQQWERNDVLGQTPSKADPRRYVTGINRVRSEAP